MNLARVVCRAALIATLAVGCKAPAGAPSDGGAPSDSGSQTCDLGAKQCRGDGLYTCDATHVFQLTEPCASCEAAPVPHCAVSCGQAGVTSICEGDSVKDCATGSIQDCNPGTCLPSGQEAICATKLGMSTCQGRNGNGAPYVLACADANGVSATQVCDERTSTCVTAEFDCSELASVPAHKVICDQTSGNYYGSCFAGQPPALACSADATCADDGSTNCYTAATPGAACGGSTVCYPGLQCTQLAADGASCVRPAGLLECNSSDVLAVCTDANTGLACFNGAVWWWKNLTAWGGSCTSDHITLPVGGVCIPGLADCKQGLECHRSRYDIAGTCRTPEANAPAECTLTSQLTTGRSCNYGWHACRDGRYYDIACRLIGAGGATATVCDCLVNGTKTNGFNGDAICNVTDTGMLDAQAMASCGWAVTTLDATPN